jgi:hypothetical protein
LQANDTTDEAEESTNKEEGPNFSECNKCGKIQAKIV